MQILDRILAYLEKNLPTMLAFLTLGYRLGTKEQKKLMAENRKLRLDAKFKENENAVRESRAGKSANQQLDDTLARAREEMSRRK